MKRDKLLLAYTLVLGDSFDVPVRAAGWVAGICNCSYDGFVFGVFTILKAPKY